ncbi:hypothetical protein [Paenibacillus taichungensis]|uniref:hypothetical protein n=1 Tax=Paenibacillus taichungensis TaxID=484184 RepID=UPI0035E10810
MAVVTKRLAKGLHNTSNPISVYSAPSAIGAKTFIKALTICSSSDTTDTSVSIMFAEVFVVRNFVLKPRQTITIPYFDHILESGESIKLASSPNTVNYYISGREVT